MHLGTVGLALVIGVAGIVMLSSPSTPRAINTASATSAATPTATRSSAHADLAEPERQALLLAEAERLGLRETAAWKGQLQGELVLALHRQIEAEVRSTVRKNQDDGALRQLYASTYPGAGSGQPAGKLAGKEVEMQLWRLVVANRDVAKSLRAKMGKDLTVAAWHRLVEEHSMDKSTHLRGGDLGWLTGTEVAVRFSGAVKQAPVGTLLTEFYPVADLSPQGDPAQAPVAIVWKRGQRPKQNPPFAQVRSQLEQQLVASKVAEKWQALLDRLRQQQGPVLGTAVQLNLGLLDRMP
jgi:hypothetical protein